jgi:hypothetical protein
VIVEPPTAILLCLGHRNTSDCEDSFSIPIGVARSSCVDGRAYSFVFEIGRRLDLGLEPKVIVVPSLVCNPVSHIRHITGVGGRRVGRYTGQLCLRLVPSFMGSPRDLWRRCRVLVLSQHTLLMQRDLSNHCFGASRRPSTWLRVLELILNLMLDSQVLLLIKRHVPILILIHHYELLSRSSITRLSRTRDGRERCRSLLLPHHLINTVFLLNPVYSFFLKPHFHFEFAFLIMDRRE